MQQCLCKILTLLALSLSSARAGASSGRTDASSGAICAAADSLSRLAEFFARNSAKTDADGFFGAAVAFLAFDSAPVSALATQRRVADLCGDAQAADLRRSVDELRQVLDNFRARVSGKNGRRGDGYDARTYWGICRPMEAVMRRLLSQSLFRWRRLDESGSDGVAIDPKDAQAWLKSVEGLGKYNEAKGDACFKRLLAGGTRSRSASCHLSSTCKRLFLSPKLGSGYTLTHKLIYWLASIHRSCHLKLTNGRSVARSLVAESCRRVLLEHRNILALNAPAATLIDLALEQAFICGSVGYRDFFADSTMLLMRRLQDEKLGCFREVFQGKNGANSTTSTGRKLLHDAVLEGGLRAPWRNDFGDIVPQPAGKAILPIPLTPEHTRTQILYGGTHSHKGVHLP